MIVDARSGDRRQLRGKQGLACANGEREVDRVTGVERRRSTDDVENYLACVADGGISSKPVNGISTLISWCRWGKCFHGEFEQDRDDPFFEAEREGDVLRGQAPSREVKALESDAPAVRRQAHGDAAIVLEVDDHSAHTTRAPLRERSLYHGVL
jgi:hypothetical protein